MEEKCILEHVVRLILLSELKLIAKARASNLLEQKFNELGGPRIERMIPRFQGKSLTTNVYLPSLENGPRLGLPFPPP